MYTLHTIDKFCEQGVGTWYYVSGPDGYLIDCGYGFYGEERARKLIDLANKTLEREANGEDASS